MRAASQKTCVLCGVDCAGKPRVKDPSGRYYCRSCHERKADELVDMAGLSAAVAAAPVGAVANCPKCRMALGPSDVLCVQCGFDIRSERGLKSRIVRDAKPSPLDWIIRPDAALKRLSRSPSALGRAAVVSLLIAFLATVGDGVRRVAGASPMIGDSWGVVVVVGVLLSAVGAVIYWTVAPVFLRWRVQWSGGEVPDPTMGRIAYFATVTPAAILSLVAAVVSPLSSASPITFSARIGERNSIGFQIALVSMLALGCVPLYTSSRPRASVQRRFQRRSSW